MLSTKTFPQEYIDDGRAFVAVRLAAVRDAGGAPELLDALVLALDHWFVHRMRGAEGKDGNPLNEVRMLAASIERHGGVLTADSTITYRPERAVLGLAIGEEILLDVAAFERLAASCFAEIETRFT